MIHVGFIALFLFLPRPPLTCVLEREPGTLTYPVIREVDREWQGKAMIDCHALLTRRP